MTDQRSPLIAGTASTDPTFLQGRLGVSRPLPPPSLWNQFTTSIRGAAGNDDPAAAAARRRDAIEAAMQPIVDELRTRGVDDPAYTQRLARDGWSLSYNRDAIWRGIARARATDGKAFEGIESDPAKFEQRIAAPVEATIAQERDVQARSGWAAWLPGQFIGGMADPINQIGMLAGAGTARSIAQAALRDARLNVGIELAQEPTRAIEEAKRGKVRGPSEVLATLGLAAGTGALFGGGVHALAEGAAAARRSVAGQLADRMRRTIGEDRMTLEERAAVAALDREDEIAGVSPYQPGVGGDTHQARMAMARDQLQTGEVTPPPAPRFDWQKFAIKTGSAESSGRWQIQAEGSSAYGLYQITRPTWLRLLRKDPEYGRSNMDDEYWWGKRTNPAMQERVFKLLVDENKAALEKAGQPVTDGNMYLMHFAGQSGATKILRAAPDTPIEQIMSRGAIEANPFLKGKTAGDVVDWAHAKMGDAKHEGAILRKDVFEDDSAWAGAQAEADAAAREIAALDAERTVVPRPDEADIGDPRTWMMDDPVIAPEVKPVGMDWEPGATIIEGPRGSWLSAMRALRDAGEGEIAGALHHPDIGPIDVKWGTPGKAAPTWAGGYGLSHILAKHPEMEARLADLPEIIAGMDIVSNDGRTVRLRGDPHEAGVRLDWDGQEQRWLVTAYDPRGGDAPAASVSSRDAADGRASPDHGAEGNIDPVPGAGKFADWIEAETGTRRWVVAPELTPELAARGYEMAIPAEDFAAMRGRWAAGERPIGADGGPPGAIEGFDGPDDIAAARQIDSLEHDLRMFLAEDEAAGLTVRLDEEGNVMSAADVLDELDTDWSVLDAAEACMKPGGDA